VKWVVKLVVQVEEVEEGGDIVNKVEEEDHDMMEMEEKHPQTSHLYHVQIN
jgi:hypothetical protein